ncbi:MAG: glycosyltransferase, partial [Methanobacteriaceae archaeon]|nr:glycosyltransferase [Methanobacteriaceae archaeon]
QNYHEYFKYMKKFFAEHPEYQIVHSHIDAMSYLPLRAAKKAGVSIRIAHSHNTSIDRDFKYILKQFFRSKITTVANYYCACGKEAGEFLFKEKESRIIPNAIEVDKFLFDKEMRKKKRVELGLKDEFVLGHVGRLSYQKNHKFLIEIFSEVHKKNKNTVLLLIGVGEKENEIKEQIHILGLDDSVRFLGNRSDVNQLYQVMDVFVMPSFFEGIPVTGIEAQFAELPCIFSTRVPEEVSFTNKCKFVVLEESIDKWAEAILSVDPNIRVEGSSTAENSWYNIKNSKGILEEYYNNISLEEK